MTNSEPNELNVADVLALLAQGRKICGNCGRPMDLSGHFCPQMN